MSQTTNVQLSIRPTYTYQKLISVVAPFLQFTPTASCTSSHPTKGGKPPEHGRAGEKIQEPNKNGFVRLNHLHMHQGSPQTILLLIFCTLSLSLHRHPSAAHRHLHTIDISNLTSNYPAPALHLLAHSTRFDTYGTHSFSPGVLIRSQYSLVQSARQFPLHSSSSKHLFIPNSIHSWHSHQISKTIYLKNILFPSLNTSHTQCLYFVQRRWYNNSFMQTLHRIYPHSTIAQHTFQSSPRIIPLIHPVYHIPFTSSIRCN